MKFDILKDLKHEGIPQVHELVFRGKDIALVQEFIEGIDLKESIFKKRITIKDVLDISIQLADILDYIHQKGVIHKDINPANIMLTRNGKVKLIDFAISSNLHSESNDMLNVDQIEGTLNYISPEQTGRTAYLVKHQCDFYSLGVLMYELVAGKPPFDSIDSLEIIHFHHFFRTGIGRHIYVTVGKLHDRDSKLDGGKYDPVQKPQHNDSQQPIAGLKHQMAQVRDVQVDDGRHKNRRNSEPDQATAYI